MSEQRTDKRKRAEHFEGVLARQLLEMANGRAPGGQLFTIPGLSGEIRALEHSITTAQAPDVAVKRSRSVTRGGLALWQVKRVRAYIEENLTSAVPLRDLASLVGLSPSHFCRTFRKSLGASPHAYIIRSRIARARYLMLTTSDSFADIALNCGLTDQAHLCRQFRKIVGDSPRAWRQKMMSPGLGTSQAQSDFGANPGVAVDPKLRTNAGSPLPHAGYAPSSGGSWVSEVR
jgi:AraC family transcriptional regulator